jgi:AraC-like DNA-binding protein
MGLSPRHFTRLFREEVGLAPASWVQRTRINAARRLLESGESAPRVASHCGYTDIETFRLAFIRLVGVTPAEYRKRYAGVSDEQ